MAFTPSGLRSVGVSRLRGVRGSSVFTLLTAHLGCLAGNRGYRPKTADAGFAFPQMWCASRSGKAAPGIGALRLTRVSRRWHPATPSIRLAVRVPVAHPPRGLAGDT